MRVILSVAAIAAVLSSGAASAQYTMNMPTGGGNAAPVPQDPPADPDDSPEEIAKDAARDLKDSRFYNKPGATRAQYDADWQTCRLIARGSRTPSGSIPYYYNPAVISPLAAGIGAGIGGAIGAAIAEGQQRRANRRSCLLIRGWRLVEVPAAESARVAAMTDADRDTFFNGLVGAADVKGEVTELTSFATPADAALKPDTALTGAGALWLGKKVDVAAPFTLAPNEGAVVVAFRRVEEPAKGRSSTIDLLRYDREHRDVLYRPRDWKKTGDLTTYTASIGSRVKASVYEVQVIRLTAGDYVINATAAGPILPLQTHCFGAPTFRVGAGEVLYLGDFIPYWDAKLSTGKRFDGLVYAAHPEDARRTLADSRPALAAKMTPATLYNGATYGCAGVAMTRWDIAGLQALPEPTKGAGEPQPALTPVAETAGTP